MTILKRLAAGATVLAAVAACETGDPVSPAGGSTGRAQLFTSGPVGPNPSLPSGTADVRTNIKVDPTVADAFGRAAANVAGGNAVGQFGRAFGFASTWRYWEWMTDVSRHGPPPTAVGVDTSRFDPRLPAITNTKARSAGIIDLYQPASPYPGDNYWEAFVQALRGLTPNKTHEIAFVQYRVTVNGQPDQAERILKGVVAQPDQLTLTPGTLGRINTDWTGTAPVGCAPFPSATTNPFVFATVASDANGSIDNVDKCWQPNGVLWDVNSFGVQSKSMVGRNDNQPYALPNYNYIEVWEGAYGTGVPVIRIQIAQDLAPNGSPLPNGFAPFPAPKTTAFSSAGGQTAPASIDQQTTYPINYAAQLALPAAFGEPDSVILQLNNLDPLGGGSVYKAWYVNRTTGVAKEAKGHFYRTVNGVIVDSSAAGTFSSTFNGGPGVTTFVTRPYAQIGAADVSDSLNTLLITVETNPSATTPSDVQPIWLTGLLKKVGGAVGTTLRFGQFNFKSGAGASTAPSIFVPQGTLSGGIIGDTTLVFVDDTVNGQTVHRRAARFVGSTIEITALGLPRPPVGLEYRGYLCRSDDDQCTTTDASTQYLPIPVDAFKTPDGKSLADADVAANSTWLSPSKILKASLTFDLSKSTTNGLPNTICSYDRFRLVLEPKGSSSTPTSWLFDLKLPALVTGATQCGL